MNTNNISLFLDVALSLTFFYFLTSMFVSGIVEFFNTIFEKRATFFQKSIQKLQGDSGNKNNNFWNKFKQNPFILNLEDEVESSWKVWGRRMSYLDSSTFVSAIVNMLSGVKFDELITDDFEKLKKQIEGFDESAFKQILKTIAQESTDLITFEEKLAIWFNKYMEHVSGWFKRYTRLVVMVTSIIVTIVLNLNTIVITKQLSSDKSLRNTIVSKAVNLVEKNSKNLHTPNSIYKNDTNFQFFLKQNYSSLSSKITVILSDSSLKNKQLSATDSLAYSEATAKYIESNIEGLGLKIGYVFKGKTWGDKFVEVFSQNNTGFLWTIIGWILTTAALSFGAPFWFDLLLKVVNVRNVMKKPESN